MGYELTISPQKLAVISALGIHGTALRPTLNDAVAGKFYIGHRGNSLRYPEDCMTAYDNAYTDGRRILEPDIQPLSGPGLGIHHDSTVDRLCAPSTGASTTFDIARWKDLVQFDNGMGYGAVPVSTFDEMVGKYAGRVIFVPEAKTTGTGQGIIDALQKFNVPVDQALISGDTLSYLAPAVTAGYDAIYLAADANAGTISAVKAAGVKYVTLNKSLADSIVTAWVAAGLRVIMYVVNRRVDRDRYAALGVFGFYSDDAEYLEMSTPQTNVDRFSLLKWQPGMFNAPETTTSASRGSFYSGGYFGWDAAAGSTSNFTLMGWACPIAKPSAFTVTFDAIFDSVLSGDTTRWFGLFVADASMGDAQYTDTAVAAESGYICYFRLNGNVTIGKKTAGVSTTLNTTTAGSPPAIGDVVRMKLTVSATQIRFERVDVTTGATISGSAAVATDSAFRGGYIHLGRNGAGGRIKNFRVGV